MATRSTISVENPDGTVDSVYCHFDGYLSHNGAILIERYNTYEQVVKLISGGAMSGLVPGSTNGEPVYYHERDGEDLVIDRYESFGKYLNEHESEEYNYIFRDGAWYVGTSSRRSANLMLVSEALALEEHEND